MTLQLVILTFALLAFLEGVFVILFPKTVLNLTKQMTKNAQSLKKVALTEIVLAVIIALAAFYLI